MAVRTLVNVGLMFRRVRPAGLDVLAMPVFRRLLVAEVLFDVSSNMRLAAQSWLVLELGGSALWVGLAAGARGAPAVVLGLFGGVAADRLPRRSVLIAGWATLALLAAGTAGLLMTDKIEAWHIVAISAGTGLAIAFTVPSAYSLVASIVPGSRLSNALGLTSLSWSSMEMAGPAITGALLAVTSASTVFWLIGGAYACAVVALLRVPEPPRERPKESASVLTDLKAGIAYVRKTQPLPVITLLAFEQNLMAVAVMPLIPVYAKDVLDVGAAGYGLLAGALGAGFLAGALTISAFGNFPRKGLTMVLSGSVWDGGAVAFGFSHSLPLSMALLFAVGYSGPFWFNAAVTAFQAKAGDEVRGRVMSVWAMAQEVFPIGWLVGGVLATTVGNERALVISALCGTPVALAFYLLSPSFRRV